MPNMMWKIQKRGWTWKKNQTILLKKSPETKVKNEEKPKMTTKMAQWTANKQKGILKMIWNNCQKWQNKNKT